MTPNAPSVLMKWAGEDESLPSLLLNSHMVRYVYKCTVVLWWVPLLDGT